MAINPDEYKSSVGLRDLYIAEVTADGDAAYTAGTPERLSYAASATATPNQSFATQYADDAAFDTIVSEGETTFDLEVTNIPLATLAKISGKVYDTTTGRLYDNTGAAPEFALGFRSLKSNGKYRYYWFPKGRFDSPGFEAQTKGETAEPKLQKLKYTALKTLYKFDLDGGTTLDGVKSVIGDEDADNFSAANWFDQVQVPGVGAVGALTLSASDPADNAPGIAVDKTCTLTFSNALSADAINNVAIVKADGVIAAAAYTIDATKKIITVNPDPNLAGASTYIITYAVTDIYGQTLRGAINFGTA